MELETLLNDEDSLERLDELLNEDSLEALDSELALDELKLLELLRLDELELEL